MAQAMSHGLTQYDVEELVQYCGGKCKTPERIVKACIQVCISRMIRRNVFAVTQGEIQGLYTRFRSLDRGHKVGHTPTVIENCTYSHKPELG